MSTAYFLFRLPCQCPSNLTIKMFAVIFGLNLPRKPCDCFPVFNVAKKHLMPSILMMLVRSQLDFGTVMFKYYWTFFSWLYYLLYCKYFTHVQIDIGEQKGDRLEISLYGSWRIEESQSRSSCSSPKVH